jgi:hypothetical protein
MPPKVQLFQSVGKAYSRSIQMDSTGVMQLVCHYYNRLILQVLLILRRGFAAIEGPLVRILFHRDSIRPAGNNAITLVFLPLAPFGDLAHRIIQERPKTPNVRTCGGTAYAEASAGRPDEALAESGSLPCDFFS